MKVEDLSTKLAVIENMLQVNTKATEVNTDAIRDLHDSLFRGKQGGLQGNFLALQAELEVMKLKIQESDRLLEKKAEESRGIKTGIIVAVVGGVLAAIVSTALNGFFSFQIQGYARSIQQNVTQTQP